MTAPVVEIDPLKDDLARGFGALNDARDAYVTAWKYYAGKLPEKFASQRIERLIKDSADNTYRFRFAKKPVTTLRNRVKVAAVTGKTDAVSAKLEQIRRANSMDMLEPFMHERVFAFGDCYALTWPVPDAPEGMPDPVPADLREAGVEITYQSPLSCRAMYDAEDGLRLEYVIRRWATKDAAGETWHAETWYPDGTIYPWVCKPGASGDAVEDWGPEEIEGEEWPLEHKWGMPIHHARNDLPYGRPEHADAMGPQDALTKLILTQVVVDLEAHGWPERYELVDSEAIKDAARDAVQWDDDTKAPAATGRTTKAKGGPGYTHRLEGVKSTGEYAAPDPALLTPVHDQWVRGLATVTDTPAYEYDPERGAGLSGIARMWADKPLRDREDNAKRFLLRFYRELYSKALEIAGISDPGELEVAWARADVIMDPDWWGVATIRREHGVPQDQILREANYPDDDIKTWLDDQDDEARSLLERITLVEKLGTALQTLGSAVALGVIDQVKVDAIVSRILGQHVVETNPAPTPAPALPASPPVPGEQVPQ